MKIKNLKYQSESYLQRQVCEFLRKANVFFYHPRETKKGTDGLPDLICCVKGLFLAIELKNPRYKKPENYLREEQKKIKEQIERAGGVYLVTNNLDDVVNVVNYIIENISKLKSS